MKILVTGFDPFGGDKINPAIESVKKLPDEIAGAQIIKLEIPTVCHQSLKVIDEAIEKENPDVVLSVGQAGGRTDITVERIGINIDDCRIPDNAGQQIIDEPVLRMDQLLISLIYQLKQWLKIFVKNRFLPLYRIRLERLSVTMFYMVFVISLKQNILVKKVVLFIFRSCQSK